MIRKLLIFLIMIGLLTSVGYSQDQQSQPVAEETALDVFGDTCEGCVTLDFRDADIRNVLQILSYRSGVNIVAGPEVTGLVTIQLTNVPWKNALDVILRTYGYGYEETGSIIIVTTIENLKKLREDALVLADQESIITKTFILNYANASDVIVSIEKMITQRGSINFDQRTNTLIVTDSVSNVSLISDVIGRLDATTPQVLIEAKIIETTLSNSENLGIDWTIQTAASGAKRPTTWPFTASSNNKYVKDAKVDEKGNPINNLDFPSPGADLFSFGTLNFNQVQAVLEILSTRSNTHILSNPRIVTLNNQTANIVVGSQYPFPEYEYNKDQATMQVVDWEYKDIGVIFKVTPHVNNSGFVTLDVEPKVTAILDFVQVENTSVPRLSSESASTRVMIADGQTLVIAGLIKNQWTDVKKKVPFLGDIPLLGLLFQKKEKTLSKTELLIFITPHIITDNIPDDSADLKQRLEIFEGK
ncbi:MAG: type IV pilus secretin PilQ [Candidatus Omnitrophica bacterium]|nr:type IV pilus secretin PilQ [Candidatus Omnitrophota bacterium]